MSYIWKQVSEKEKEEIRKNAKDLLDNFSKKLEKLSVKEEKISAEKNLRNEGKSIETNQEFREFMFDNAPSVSDGLIIAEVGKWKK